MCCWSSKRAKRARKKLIIHSFELELNFFGRPPHAHFINSMPIHLSWSFHGLSIHWPREARKKNIIKILHPRVAIAGAISCSYAWSAFRKFGPLLADADCIKSKRARRLSISCMPPGFYYFSSPSFDLISFNLFNIWRASHLWIASRDAKDAAVVTT